MAFAGLPAGSRASSDSTSASSSTGIGSSVRWLDSMRHLLAQGIDEFEEAGPGVVLTKLIGQIRKKLSGT